MNHSLSKKAFYSQHIFCDEISDPIEGFLLISSSHIECILPCIPTTFTPLKTSLRDEGYEINDYADYYICPGLIDPHVSLNSSSDDSWQDIANITKMAASGGITTIIDHPVLFKENN